MLGGVLFAISALKGLLDGDELSPFERGQDDIALAAGILSIWGLAKIVGFTWSIGQIARLLPRLIAIVGVPAAVLLAFFIVGLGLQSTADTVLAGLLTGILFVAAISALRAAMRPLVIRATQPVIIPVGRSTEDLDAFFDLASQRGVPIGRDHAAVLPSGLTAAKEPVTVGRPNGSFHRLWRSPDILVLTGGVNAGDIEGYAAGGRPLRRRLVVTASAYLEHVSGRVDLRDPDLESVVRAQHARFAGSRALQRGIDIIVSLLLLITFLPLMVVVAVAIRLESPGPALFWQQRIGRNGRPFQLVKFRSMRRDAEASGASWAQVADSRVTRLGHFLRSTRLDEIPQLFNILRGEMSLVGPRPERPEFTEALERRIPHYALRHLVRPGLTGWAQVQQGYTASVEETAVKTEFDLYYIANGSLLLYFVCLLGTPRIMLWGSGSR